MTHEMMKEKLLSYFDGELDDKERQEMIQHLAGCHECRQALERWKQIKTSVFRTPAPTSGETFVYQVMSRLDDLAKPAVSPAPWKLPFLRWLFPALGYTVAFVVMFTVIAERQAPVSAGEILLADIPQQSQWAFAESAPSAAQVMEM